jgi:hypothetical protein
MLQPAVAVPVADIRLDKAKAKARRVARFQIDPNTPLKDLLPPTPKASPSIQPTKGDDLAVVPEVVFQAPLPGSLGLEKVTELTAHQMAKINHLNGKQTDGFLEALRGQRPDLAGLSFAMGDACRTKGDRSKQFAAAVATIRGALQRQALPASFIAMDPPLPVPPPAPVAPAPVAPAAPAGTPPAMEGLIAPSAPAVAVLAASVNPPDARTFWEQYRSACDQEDKANPSFDGARQELVTVCRIAALMQVLAPEPADMRLGLVKYLSGVSHVEATKALARLAIFSPEEEVQRAAVAALRIRRERDYTDILVQGLRYPWAAAARRAADALVRLERTDLIPRLVDLLDEPDPRAPVTKEVDGKKTTVVKELVRVNHHRSCLLCHAPSKPDTVALEALTAEVPLPGVPLPEPFEGYGNQSPDLLVRIDVTYLRQDFSVRQAVADANPWPEMQRFDFLVRTRELTEAEAEAYRAAYARPEPGRPSPYQSAALAALRDLTGKDTEPTAEGWRRLLELPPKQKTATP